MFIFQSEILIDLLFFVTFIDLSSSEQFDLHE